MRKYGREHFKQWYAIRLVAKLVSHTTLQVSEKLITLGCPRMWTYQLCGKVSFRFIYTLRIQNRH